VLLEPTELGGDELLVNAIAGAPDEVVPVEFGCDRLDFAPDPPITLLDASTQEIAIAIEQKTTSRNPRSTVGTVTEIYDYLRLLYARVGTAYSPATGKPIAAQSVRQIVERLRTQQANKKLFILAPIVRGRKGEHRKKLQELLAQGYQRVRIDKNVYELDLLLSDQSPTPLNTLIDRKKNHDIDIVIDRVVMKDADEARLADSIETALNLADGIMYSVDMDDGTETAFSSRFCCPVSGFTIDEIEPRLFSFNSPQGACRACDGIGTMRVFALERIIPDHQRSLQNGAVKVWHDTALGKYNTPLMLQAAQEHGIDINAPWDSLNDDQHQWLLNGDGSKRKSGFIGIMPLLQRQYQRGAFWVHEELNRYMSERPCPTCNGQRLKPEALAVKIDNKTIIDVTHLTITACLKWVRGLDKKLTAQQKEIASRILNELTQRLSFLNDVGLTYLTLERRSATLSGGEGQRIRLASQIGSGLTGIIYVLDEPSIGLHQRDNQRLINTLLRLRDQGNTVIVVEHDEETIRAADHIVDMGPEAGIHGGDIVAQGTLKQVLRAKKSLTADYLNRKKAIDVPQKRRTSTKDLTIIGARHNNLKNLTVRFPLQTFTCVTGVSGSGKSTLVIDTLYQAMHGFIYRSGMQGGTHDRIDGLQNIDKVIDIDQSPIGRTPRSNPATYTGTFNFIRQWFASLPEAQARGYAVGRFSFNVTGGRCEHCKGDGVIKIEMHFMPDVYVTCEACNGKRYNHETLAIRYRGKTIADVLDMTVEEALDFFKAIPPLKARLTTLMHVGLGYIHLGQQATTLSGGESQRVKLARELAKTQTGRTLYILDEPTTGLHFEDVRKLLNVLHRLVEQGNSVIVIEHNLDVIKTADHIIDMGPEGGDKGGTIIAQGTPEHIVSQPGDTARYLKPLLPKPRP